MGAGTSLSRPGTVAVRAGLKAVAALLDHVHGDAAALRYVQRGQVGRDRQARVQARADLSTSLDDLSRHVDLSLAGFFREYVGATIQALSPLVASACRVEGLDLDTVVGSLRPDGVWRPWLGGPAPFPASRWRRATGRALADLQDQAVLRRFARCGVVIREEGEPRGALGFRVGARCLELAMRSARMQLSTNDGRAVLTLRQPVPETIRLAVRGRLLDEVVDLPLTNGRGLRIVRAIGRPGGGTSLEFQAEPLPWRLPWAREWVRGAPDGGGHTEAD